MDNRIMVTTYTVEGDSFVAGKPRLWSDKQIQATNPAWNLAAALVDEVPGSLLLSVSHPCRLWLSEALGPVAAVAGDDQ